MISSFNSKNEAASGVFNCTTASTFEKLNSLKFEVLFGEYRRKVEKEDSDGLVKQVDYMFEPNQVFGFAYQSTGVEFKKMHQVFVLRACEAGETGNAITGISPGAEVLVKTLSHTGSRALRAIIQKLQQSQIDFNKVPLSQYRRINDLLEMKARGYYFLEELIEKHVRNEKIG